MGMSKKQLEKKYGIKIVKDECLNEYKVYTADGCKWTNGLSTIKAVENECNEWSKELLAIKDNVKG